MSSSSPSSLYHPSLVSSATADSKMSPTMSLTRDGKSTNDAKAPPRSEPWKASSKKCDNSITD